MRDLRIVVPIVTPCTRAGDPDLDGLKALCQDMLDAGCSGLFVAGSSGRGPWFSRHDRVRICRAVADQVGAGVPLLAGCMASGLPQMLENAHAMADAGAQMAVVTVPGYFNYSQQEIEIMFSKFGDSSPLPVVVYDIPDLSRTKLDVDLLIRLAHHDNVVGCKDSTADYAHFEGLLAGLSDCPDFCLLQGKERYLVDSLVAGASGFVVSMVQIDPRPFVRLSQAVWADKMALAQRLQNEITKIMDVFEGSFARRPETSTFFHLLNWTLRHRGACDNILLEHDGDCPSWLADNAREVVEICETAATIQE